MKKIHRKLIILSVCSMIFFPASVVVFAKTFQISEETSLTDSVTALTLTDCYALALKQSETIAIDAEVIKEAEAHFLQALSILLPHVSFFSQDKRQDSVVSPGRKGMERKFVFKQTLFSGFKGFAAISASNLERDQRVNEKLRAQQLLFTDVSDAFYLLIEQREDLRTLQIVRDAFADRMTELKSRERIGKSRRSEVVNTEAQLYSVEADIETDKSQEAVARQLLEFLIGRPVGNIIDPADIPLELKTENEYINRADSRADVVAAGKAWELTRKNTIVAKSGLLPTVSVEGNYYTSRTTAPQDNKWDALFKVDVPIFDGAETLGAIKAANAQMRESQLQFQRAKRSAIQDIRDAYVRFKTAISRSNALKKAFAAAEMNYGLQRDDYRKNLVNNLDVLSAIQTLENTRRSFIEAAYETKRLYWQLQVAVGENPTGKTIKE